MRSPAASARLARAIGAVCVLLAACSHRAPPTPPGPLTTPRPVAVSATLDLEPLDLSPDGEARLLVMVHYRDATGVRVHIPPGGHVDVSASRGSVQWQPRSRFGDPSAIVRLTGAGPLSLRVTSDLPRLPRVMHAATDTRAWRLAPVTAKALGPHVVVIGWFPRVLSGTVRMARNEVGRPATRTVAVVNAPVSSFRDTSVEPGAHYTYAIARPHAHPIDVAVDLPRELAPSGIAAVRGKAMWLSFDDVSDWRVDAMLERAQQAGIHAIELRLTYGEVMLITPARKTQIDRLIDGAAHRGIAVIGWTVPRAVTFEDLAANVVAAAYRTPSGHGISGLAVDLERGADFLDVGNNGSALADYIARLREALGPHVLLVATVEDPSLERLQDDAIPYAAIAAKADVLQPMTYWRMRGAGASIAGMRSELQDSYRAMVRLAGRPIPIDIGGQTANLGNRYGAPPPAEVAASLQTALALGAIGETFFDWDATSAAQWSAIAATPWSRKGATFARAPMSRDSERRSAPVSREIRRK